MKSTLALALLTSSVAFSQERAVSAGNDFIGVGGSVSFTVGIPDYQQVSTGGNFITEGIQQPYEIYSLSVEEWDMSIPISVFPNPTVNYFTIALDILDQKNLSYELNDASGRLILKGTLTETQTLVDVSTLIPATYFLSIINSQKNIQSYKLIKN